MLTSHRSIKWIENLADQEKLIRAGERVSIDLSRTKEEVLAVETASFVRDLYYHVEYFAQLFNQKLFEPDLQLRVLKNGDSVDGFTVERNGMRLVVGRPQVGAIQLACEKRVIEEDSRSYRTSVMFSGRVEGRFGVFHDVEWAFLGSPITAEQVARHYLTEFIQASR